MGDISRNCQDGVKVLHNCDNYIEADVIRIIHGTIIPAGTVVFAKIGEAIKLNRRAITRCDSLIDNNAMGLRPNNDIGIDYFYSYMQQLDMSEYAGTTAVPSVRKTTLEKVPLLVPPLELQNRFSQFVQQVDKSKFYGP